MADVTTPEEEDLRPELLVLVLLRDQLQKLRIAEGNRAGAAERLDEQQRHDLHAGYEARIFELEHEIEKAVRTEMHTHPVWPWLSEIHGVAELSAALVLSHIDIERANTVSALWRYAGYAVIDGHRERPTKGQKLQYNSRLKSMVWRIIDLQIKLRGPYRDMYDAAKHTYMTTRMAPADASEEPEKGERAEQPEQPEAVERTYWTLGHCEQAARRRAAKLFLSHLWLVWRQAVDLPVTLPFIFEHGEPEHDYIDPWEFIRRPREKKP